MRQLNIRKILLIVVALIVVAGVFAVFFQRINTATLQLTIKDTEQERVTVTSNIKGRLGEFKPGIVNIRLSKAAHTITVKGPSTTQEIFAVDMKTGNKQINIDLKKEKTSEQIILNDNGDYRDIPIKDCVYFGNKTWLVCKVVNVDFGETNVYHLENASWKYITSGSFLTALDLSGTDAPQELLDYLGGGADE